MKNDRNWSTEEKKIFDRFDKLSNFNLHENQFINDSKSGVQKQNDANIINSNQHFSNKTSYDSKNNEINWRKQPKYRQPFSTNNGYGKHNYNKSSWRNQQDRHDDQSEHAQGSTSQRQLQ